MSQPSTKDNSHEKLTMKNTTIIERVNKMNTYMEEVLCEYKTSRDVQKTYSSLQQIQKNIESIFDNMTSSKLEEDELNLLTVICRKMNEDTHIQEIRYNHYKKKISADDKTLSTQEDEKKPKDQLPQESDWKPVGVTRSPHKVNSAYNPEENGETEVKPVEIKQEKEDVSGKYADVGEEEEKVEGASPVKIQQNEDHKVRSAVNEEPVVMQKPVIVFDEKESQKIRDELNNIVQNMKDEFGNYKLDETYSWYIKLRDFANTRKLQKEDLAFYHDTLSENKVMMENIENYHDEAQILVNELESDEGYVLESSKKNFEIKYKMSEGGLVSLKMAGIIDVPLFNFLALIYEMDCYNQWMPFNKESKEIKKVTTTSKAGWLKFNIPPPISNREAYIYGVGFNRLEVNGSVLIVAKSFHNDEKLAKKLEIDIPATSKLTRIDIHYMGAAIVPISHDKIKVKMVTKLDPKLKFIPTSVVSWFVRKTSSFLLDILVKKATNFKGSVWEQRITENTEFYGWLEEEINKYLKLQATQEQHMK